MLYLTAALVLLFLFWYSSRSKTMSLLERCGIPGPKPNLIFGNVFQMMKMTPMDYQKQLINTYGRVVGYYTGAQPTILVADNELIKAIQTKDFNSFQDRPQDLKFIIYEKINDGSIFITTGESWKNTRKLMTPSFSPSKLKSMTPLIEKSIDTFIDIIGKNAEKGVEVNVYPLAESLVAEIVIKTAFGIENNIQINTKHKIFEDVQEFMSTPINMPLYLLVNCFPWLFHVFNYIRRLHIFSRNCVIRLSKNLSDIIKLRKGSSIVRRNDIMQALIDSTIDENDQGKQHRMTEKEIIANAMHLYFAAYDTTSITIANVTHHLVNYSDVQENIRQEVQELFEREGKLDFNGVFTGLQTLDCVIKETLRLYPPVVSFVSRECLQDYKYKDMTIPKGSTVLIAAHPMHYDEEFWPNPETFDPMRFSPERKHEIIPFTYQAFGDGSRNCIGMRLAFLEMKLLFAKLLLNYRLECGPNTEIGKLSTKFGVATVSPKNGVFVKAVKI